jgi:hypothetical protein
VPRAGPSHSYATNAVGQTEATLGGAIFVCGVVDSEFLGPLVMMFVPVVEAW